MVGCERNEQLRWNPRYFVDAAEPGWGRSGEELIIRHLEDDAGNPSVLTVDRPLRERLARAAARKGEQGAILG